MMQETHVATDRCWLMVNGARFRREGIGATAWVCHQTVARIREMRLTGLSYREIGRELGVDAHKVRRLARALGCEGDVRACADRARWVTIGGERFQKVVFGVVDDAMREKIVRAIVRAHHGGATDGELGRRFRIGKQTVRKLLRATGIVRRRGGRQASHGRRGENI